MKYIYTFEIYDENLKIYKLNKCTSKIKEAERYFPIFLEKNRGKILLVKTIIYDEIDRSVDIYA